MPTFKNLDWDDLRFFLEAARSLSLSLAARRLRVDHSTVSRRISRLEGAAGTSLFERGAGGVSLTESGHALLSHAEEIEGCIIAAGESAADIASPSGSVRLATMEGIASLYLAPRLHRLRDRHPNIKLELVTSSQLVHVNRREADIFIGFFEPAGNGLVFERIGAFQVGLYGSGDYLARRGMPAGLADLADHDFISYIEDLIHLNAVRWLDDIVRAPRVVFHSSSMIAQMGAARAGVGLVALPAFCLPHAPELVPVLGGHAGTRREVWLCAHQNLRHVPRVKAVVAFIKSLLLEDRDMLQGRA